MAEPFTREILRPMLVKGIEVSNVELTLNLRSIEREKNRSESRFLRVALVNFFREAHAQLSTTKTVLIDFKVNFL